jgi:endonuclease YncB( thermonuclease family)
MNEVIVQKWDQATAASRLKKVRRRRITGIVLVTIVAASIIADHLRAQNRHGDDWLRFDGHPVQFVKAVSGQSIAVRDDATDDMTIVLLKGIRSAGAEWDDKSVDRLDAVLTGKNVTLHLKPTDPRDNQGRLAADVFVDGRELVSADLVAEGLARIDRTSKSDFLTTIGQKETQAKKHRLGLWSGWK